MGLSGYLDGFFGHFRASVWVSFWLLFQSLQYLLFVLRPSGPALTAGELSYPGSAPCRSNLVGSRTPLPFCGGPSLPLPLRRYTQTPPVTLRSLASPGLARY